MEIPEGNHLVDPDEPHAEVIEIGTQRVWQTRLPITRDAFHALTLEPGLAKIGIGLAAMDGHYFRRSPGAREDGPVETRTIDGRVWVHCAKPASAPSLPAGPEGPRLLTVDKHHSLIFRAGREIEWLRLPDGRAYVHVIEGGSDKAPLGLPDGWTLSTEVLSEERTIHLPHPTTVFFFPNGDSYQGPIERGA